MCRDIMSPVLVSFFVVIAVPYPLQRAEHMNSEEKESMNLAHE